MTLTEKVLAQTMDMSRAVMVAGLCVLMVVPMAVAAVPGGSSRTSIPAVSTHEKSLMQSQRVLQALNRFTFGPRPGDKASVEKMGLQRWFEQQLHPETIDDSAFEVRMQQFPTLQLSTAELIKRYPTPLMVRQIMRRDLPLPSDPVERAIYADSIAAYKARVAKASGMPAPNANQDMAVNRSDMASPESIQTKEGMASTKPSPEVSASMTDAAKDARHRAAGLREAGGAAMARDEVQAILALPPNRRVAKILAMSPQEVAGFRLGMRRSELGKLMAGLSPEQRDTLEALQGSLRMVEGEALEARLERDVYSERQLQAVMADFWLNHFSVYARKNQLEPYMLASFERDTILPNALGKFENLLVATAESPAMLMYLDNWESIGPDSQAAKRVEQFKKNHPDASKAKNTPQGINENYGRELMELHTLGVNGGYTQKDVIAVSRCLTGWTIDRPYGGGGRRHGGADEAEKPGQFVFVASRHEPGPEVVLGHTIPAGGMSQGLAVLHLLATSPATAHFISTELAERFVSDSPPRALVDRMAATFLKSDGDIKAVLTTMFRSSEFWSPKVYRAKVKTPIEFMVSALRASDASVANPEPLVQAMSRLGMPIYGMQTPNGYSWEADHWVSTTALISRMNFALVLSGGRVRGTKMDWARLLEGNEASEIAANPTPATEKKLEEVILGQPAAAQTRTTVLAQFKNPTAQHDAQKKFGLDAALEQSENGKENDGQKVAESPAYRPAYDATMMPAGRRWPGKGGRRIEAPLDTMAGLLLGSPDFQKR